MGDAGDNQSNGERNNYTRPRRLATSQSRGTSLIRRHGFTVSGTTDNQPRIALTVADRRSISIQPITEIRARQPQENKDIWESSSEPLTLGGIIQVTPARLIVT